MSTITNTILAQVVAYCARAGIAQTTFGQRAVADTAFVQRLRDGRTSLRVCDKALTYIRDNPAPAPSGEAA